MTREELQKNPKLMEYLVGMIAKDDVVVKDVWTHYFINKRKEPIDPWRVKHFWQRLQELMGNNKWLEKR
jgi:hypothetical protein